MGRPRKPPQLPEGFYKLAEDAVDALYERVRERFLHGRHGDKAYAFSVPKLYEMGAKREGVERPDQAVSKGLVRVADAFLRSHQEKTKAQVVKAVESWIREAHSSGVKTNAKTVLGGELADIFGKAQAGVQAILATESNSAKNLGALEGIMRVNAASGIGDPVVYFSCPPVDDDTCDECRRLHYLADLVTPRVWRMSELKHGYAKKGDEAPSLSGQHPHCRGTLQTLMPGYGFDGGGVTFISPDHDEYVRQRG